MIGWPLSSIVALIPARAGSKRIPGKNLKLLAGLPLFAYSVLWAKLAGIFTDIIVCSDSVAITNLAITDYGVSGRVAGPPCHVDTCCDITWVRDIMRICPLDAFAILRPTSPFRNAESIKSAWASLQHSYDPNGGKPYFDSVRAVAKYEGPHPAKCWRSTGKRITMIKPWVEETHPDGTPFHSSPTQSLKTVWRQTGGLEMAWTRVLTETGTISGTKVHPLILSGPEALDINTPEDWAEAERLVASVEGILPEVE